MRIATFNCNSIRARLGAVLGWCKRHQPDVLCLQETKVVDDDFPVGVFTQLEAMAARGGPLEGLF